MGNLFTVGHSTITNEKFVALLKYFNIDFIMDVRSVPYSKYASQFNKETIKEVLERNSIGYAHMGKFFGARQENIELYNDEGYLDFNKVREWETFKVGYDSVIRGLEHGHNIALMCTEKSPLDCHRAIMVARAFELNGINVNHVLHDKTLLSQVAFNEELLKLYHLDKVMAEPTFEEINLFDDASEEKKNSLDRAPYIFLTVEERIKKAYDLRNAKIGYRRPV